MKTDKLRKRLIAGLLRHYATRIALLWYAVFAIYYKSPNPLLWTHADSFLFFSFLLVVPALLLVSSYFNKNDIDPNLLIEQIFDIHQYRRNQTKLLDCILSHYTNVATIGLFIMVLIVMLKPHVVFLPSIVFGPVLAVSLLAIFFIYALFLLRIGVALLDRSKIKYYFGISLVLFIDMQAIDLFIKSVPGT